MDKWIFDTVINVYNKLCDEKSKNVFRAKYDFMIDKDESKFLEWFLDENDQVICPELDQYENKKKKKYIIFGIGSEGRRAAKILNASSRILQAWCDNS